MLLKSILDLIIPRTCCICGRRLAIQESVICTVCTLRLPHTGFIDDPYENEMAKVFWGRVKHFEKAYAPIYHKPHSDSARVVYQLKYFDKPEIGVEVGKKMGKVMNRHGFFDDIDCIMPVPLEKKRERKRGYNQSYMLAKGLSEISHLPIITGVVRRLSFESSQTTKSRMQRFENVDRTFELIDGEKVKDKHILIVDDVVTTGATICAVAKQLQRMDNVKISVASIAYAGEWRFSKK